jgi:hypothetical protein
MGSTLVAVVSLPWLFVLAGGGLMRNELDAPSARLGAAEFLHVPTSQVERWGRLIKHDIMISPPLEFVDAMTADRASTDWHFPGTDVAAVDQQLAHLNLSESSRSRVMALARPDTNSPGFVVVPPQDLLWELPTEDRGRLYHWLGLFPTNRPQMNAFRFSGTLEQWFASTQISQATFELVRKLLYRQGQTIFLADIEALLARIDRREHAPLLKALAGERTVTLTLHVGPDDEIDRLVEYWGRGRRAKDVRPLLESLARRPGGGEIDVAHLLPAFARERLYTYPIPFVSEDLGRRDCHWSAMNFFSETPDDRFGDQRTVFEERKTNYHPISDELMLGDLLVYADQSEYYHSAIYIADDIVFTKNGPLASRPWTFMRLDQMKEFYPRASAIEIFAFRRNDL